jgi:2-polyprenyl-3-methyl-5-hydroxy-6-metoxy-1,4-benzoquinol methylase
MSHTLSAEQFDEGLAYAEKNLSEDVNTHLWLDKKIIKEKLNLTGKRILDFGCGMGGMSLWYAKNWDCFVHGIDIDSHHITVAKALKEKYRAANVAFEEIDVLDERISEPYDLIFLNDVIEHLPLSIIDDILGKLSALLNPEGQIYVSYPPWESPYASHVYNITHTPWCQFLPNKLVYKLIAKRDRQIVGKLENNFLDVYRGLNKMNHEKLLKILNRNNLIITYRKNRSILNRFGFFSNSNTTLFPLNYLVTKEIIFLKKK